MYDEMSSFWLHPTNLTMLGGLLLLSYGAGKLAQFLGAPKITGYLVVGMLISPHVTGWMAEHWVQREFSLVTDFTLAVIAFLIGGSLEWSKMKKLGKEIGWITCSQGVGAMLLVIAALWLGSGWVEGLDQSAASWLPFALLMGALNSATAPATTLATIHECRAQGEFTNCLLGVVALDDALAIILFAFAAALSVAQLQGGGAGWAVYLLNPLFDILGAFVLGGLGALVMILLVEYSSHHRALLVLTLALVLLVGGFASQIGISSLLTNMVMGAVVANFIRLHSDIFESLEVLEEPLYGLFFLLAGAHLDLTQLKAAGVLGLLLVGGRLLGKVGGAWVGASIAGASPPVRRYFGWALMPQEGVSLGLAMAGAKLLGPGSLTDLLLSGVLVAVIVNELISPFLTRDALIRSGEARRG